MTDLRWVLLLIALAVLGGLFLWTRFRSQLPRMPGRIAGRSPEASLPVPAAEKRVEPVLGPPAEAGGPPVTLPAKIVTIRLMGRISRPFPAEEVVLAMRSVGLRHGRFGIFHRYPSDRDHDEDPVFSVASLVEPGSFDLTQLQTDVYPGVSLFLGLPGPVDGVVAFDAMMAAARAMAARLGGDLVDEQGSTLSVQRERYLREEVIQFQHRRGRAG